MVEGRKLNLWLGLLTVGLGLAIVLWTLGETIWIDPMGGSYLLVLGMIVVVTGIMMVF